jgi:release factor glutamine methyltransferase
MLVTIGEALRAASARLAKVSDTARLDAELLMAEALRVSRSDLLLRHTADAVAEAFEALLARRERHEPIAYILGRQEFYGRDFVVAPGVLIPRADSETIVAAALDACPHPGRVLDCGVGSGALLFTVLAERGGTGVGIDRSPEALAIAAENAARHTPGAARLLHADWHEPGWADGLGRFDLILANPPYVEEDAGLSRSVREWEPAGALFAGKDGLDDYRILVPQLPALLEPHGVAVLEIGATQAAAVARIADAVGFSSALRHDLAGRARALVLGQPCD